MADLPPLSGLSAEALSHVHAKFSFAGYHRDNRRQATTYRLQYRPTHQPDWPWRSVDITDTVFIARELAPGTPYEVKAGVVRNGIASQWSQVTPFTTQAPPEQACYDDEGPLPEITNREPLPNALVGDQIAVGKFTMRLQEVRGGDGVFSGRGTIYVPWMGLTLPVQFDRIAINTDYRMTDGLVHALSKPLDEWREGIEEFWEDRQQLADTTITVSGYLEAVTLKEPAEGNNEATTDSRTYVVTLASGETLEIQQPPGQSVAVTDSQGRTIVIDEEGRIGPILEPEADTPVLATGDRISQPVYFTAYEHQHYGFDTQLHEAYAEHYESLPLSEDENSEYPIAWKALATGQTDRVTLKGDTTDLKLYTETGQPVPILEKTDDEHYTLLLTGQGDKEEGYLQAIRTNAEDSTESLSGKLNTVSYAPEHFTLKVVPVNGAGYMKPDRGTDILKALKATYGPAVVNWTVTYEKAFTADYDTDGDGALDDGNTGMLSNYTPEMRKLIRRYEQAHKTAEGTYYLFLVHTPKSAIDEDGTHNARAGFMPYKRQFGFIFTSRIGNPDHFDKTIAHELGHGAFRLPHTFVEAPALEEWATKNLMDYTFFGTELHKHQWDLIHNPRPVWGLLTGDEEVAMSDYARINALLDFIRENKGNATPYKKLDFYTGHSWSDVVQLADYEGEQLRLYVELSDNGVLDLAYPDDIYLKTGLSVDPERHTHTGFYLDIPYADKEGTAIRLWAYTFEDFEKLLHRIGFHIPSIAHPYYLDIYKQAIANADGDCDKLDVIYETIPPFVASELPDESLYQALISLSGCIMDDGLYVNGTNEEIAVINILKAYSDKQALYQTLHDHPGLVHDLYAGLDGEDLSTFVNILWELSNRFGPGQTEHFIRLGEVPAEVYEVNPAHRGLAYVLVEGSRFNSRNHLGLYACLGRRNFGTSVQCSKEQPGIADVNPLDLVKLHTGSQEEVLLVPALFVYYHGTQSNREHLMEVISTGSNLLGLGAASKILLTRGAPALLRMLAVIEIGKLALDEAMERSDVRQAIRDEGGDWFVDNYYWISITVDLTVFSADVLTDLVTNGRKASKALRAQGETEAADKLDDIIEQAEEAKRVRGESMIPESLFAGYPHLNGIRSQELIAKIQGLNLDGTTLSKLDETLSDASLLAKFEAEPGLAEAWAIVKNTGFDDLARNTDVLEEVTKLGAKTLDGNPLDIAKLFDNGLGKTLNKALVVDKTKILSRINEWDASKVDDLARRLGKDNYPNLADDLADPDFFKLYDDIINDPENALDIAKKAGDGNLITTAKSAFFNDITKLGKDFEGVVAPALSPGGTWRNKLSDVVKNKFGIDDLGSYEMYKQVQFTYNKSTGDYFVSDQVFVKYGFDADGDKFIENIIVIESKLSDGTKLTGNQSAARNVSEYTVRSRQFVELSQGLEVKSNNWLRAYGDGSGKNIVDITDEFK
ncbi:fibronectin type III domain-containing protein [Roseivirga sp. BDSF3-8]|uniref:fibronectin type III domain-containing protein n=1 Tax=Roseivirga sp. BDSF3-8 TaxID=3241598 RepID=UPI003531E025